MKKLFFLILTLGILLTGCDRCEREDSKPERVFTIEGNILNPENGEPISGMMLRLQGTEAGNNTKWAIDRDTTDEKGYFKLQYTKKDVFVISNRTTTVYHEDPNHIGLPHSIIWSTDTMDIEGDFCYGYGSSLPVKFEIKNFNNLDSFFLIIRDSKFMEYDNIPKMQLFDSFGNRFQVSYLKKSKQELQLNNTIFINYGIGTYVYPGARFSRVEGFFVDDLDKIQGLYNFTHKDFPDSSHLSDPRIIYEPLTSCLEEKVIELDCAKL